MSPAASGARVPLPPHGRQPMEFEGEAERPARSDGAQGRRLSLFRCVVVLASLPWLVCLGFELVGELDVRAGTWALLPFDAPASYDEAARIAAIGAAMLCLLHAVACPRRWQSASLGAAAGLGLAAWRTGVVMAPFWLASTAIGASASGIAGYVLTRPLHRRAALTRPVGGTAATLAALATAAYLALGWSLGIRNLAFTVRPTASRVDRPALSRCRPDRVPTRPITKLLLTNLTPAGSGFEMANRRSRGQKTTATRAQSQSPGAISRRAVLRGAGLLGLGLTFGRFAAPAEARIIRPPGTLPFPRLPEGTDTLPQIQNIIILMMENHSFDNYFGVLGPQVGFPLRNGEPRTANPDGNGNLIHSFHMPTTCQPDNAGPTQSWNASHISFSGGNDGFVLASGPIAMGYWTGDDLPFYYGLAQTFPLASRWFCSTLCQTYPNRRFLMAGTAAGIINTSVDSLQAPAPPNGNIFDRLNAHGISWRNYYSDVPSIGVLLQFALQNADKVGHIAQFFSDAAAGTLPAVSLVDPVYVGEGSEENGDIRIGELFASQVINAAMASPQWPHTLLVLLYDEHGGYYDHVRPPRAIAPDDIPPNLGPGDQPGGYDRYGFRVPAVVVSPYARPNHISRVVRDHTAILKFIERKWNLGALTRRDANADDLSDCLDFRHPPAFLNPPTLPTPALGVANPPPCATGPIPPPDAVTPVRGGHAEVIAASERVGVAGTSGGTSMGEGLADAWAPFGIGPRARPR